MKNLETLFMFDGLRKEDTDKILSALPEPKCFAKGEEIYSHAHFSKALGIIVSGKAEATDGCLLKRTFVSGDVFGAAALFGSEDSYISHITAKSDAVVQFIAEDTMKDIFQKHPKAAVNYIRFLSQRVRFLNKRLNLMAQKDASAKLYRFLSENADENNIYTADNMSKLAALTSIGRTSLYRAIDELTAVGMIKKSGTKFMVM